MVSTITAAAQLPRASDHYLYASKLDLDSLGSIDSLTAGKDIAYFCAPDLKTATPGAGAIDTRPTSALAACKDLRAISEQGDKLHVVYVDRVRGNCPTGVDDTVEIAVEEHVRKTAFSKDVSSVLKFILNKNAAAPSTTAAPPDAIAPSQRLCYFDKAFTFKNLRATADVTVDVKGAGSDTSKATTQLITGPEEHWFLSADAVVNGVKELKYDPDKKIILERDKPQQVYLGINYLFGDVYKRYDAGDGHRLVAKLLIAPSRRPFDSVGIGLGYRFADGVFTMQKDQPTGGFILFIGSFWTKGDQLDASGAVVQAGRKQSWRLGMSYGLDTLFDWIK
ncbi:hypothetical protein DZC73_01665 [Albitalea terrae]|uniref:Uncharacterized protein n=2 Tax=Piscinibacter terrae TaxID=2496871 RepID=A0A3N7HU17_9BURK|nr:hypothetical protein DZC73_01665 [Albitalea terrae]